MKTEKEIRKEIRRLRREEIHKFVSIYSDKQRRNVTFHSNINEDKIEALKWVLK